MPAFNWEETKTPKHRWLVYGIPGVGKTTLSKYLEGKTYLLSLDDSFHRIDYWKDKNDIWNLDPQKPIEDLNDFIKSFDPSKYDNLIIDNLSNLQKLWFVEKARETSNGLDNKIQHYGEINNWFIRLISKLFSYDLNILVTAWESQNRITNSMGQEFEQYGPNLRDDIREFLMGNCDVVARLTQKPKTGERGFVLQGNDGLYAKNRLDNRSGCKVDELFKNV